MARLVITVLFEDVFENLNIERGYQCHKAEILDIFKITKISTQSSFISSDFLQERIPCFTCISFTTE